MLLIVDPVAGSTSHREADANEAKTGNSKHRFVTPIVCQPSEGRASSCDPQRKATNKERKSLTASC